MTSEILDSVYRAANNITTTIIGALNFANNLLSQTVNNSEGITRNILSSLLASMANTVVQSQYAAANGITAQIAPLYQKTSETLDAVRRIATPDISPVINIVNASNSYITAKLSSSEALLDAATRNILNTVIARSSEEISKLDMLRAQVTAIAQIGTTSELQGYLSSANAFYLQTQQAIQSNINAGFNAVKQASSETVATLRQAIAVTSEQYSQGIRQFSETASGAINAAKGVYEQAVAGIIATSIQGSEAVRSTVETALGQFSTKTTLELPEEVSQSLADISKVLASTVPGGKPDTGQVGFVTEIADGLATFVNSIVGLVDGLARGRISSLDQISPTILHQIPTNPSLLEAVSALLAVLPAVTQLLGISQIAVTERLRQLALKEYTPGILSPQDVAVASRRGLVDREVYDDTVKRQGLDGYWGQVMRELTLNPLTPDTYIAAWLRGEITLPYLNQMFEKLGIADTDKVILEALAAYIPPVPDLIRMAIREVFSPDIARTFGQYEDYPEAFNHYANMQGVSDDWAKRYWAAHWELPSLQMGFEMLHRGVIDTETLDLLMRAQDVMPYWRSKLRQISYSPLTRVDVRRMYGVGVLNREEVKHAYKDLGYDDVNAERLAEFTVRYESAADEDSAVELKALTRATIETAYVSGILTLEEAINRLMELNYSRENAELLLRIKDFNKAIGGTEGIDTDFAARGVKMVKDAYLRKVYSEEEAINQLMALGYTPSQATTEVAYLGYEYDQKLRNEAITRIRTMYGERTIGREVAAAYLGVFNVDGNEQLELLGELDALRDLRTEKLSRADLRGLLRKGIISYEEYAEELRGLGLNEKYVIWLLQLEGSEAYAS